MSDDYKNRLILVNEVFQHPTWEIKALLTELYRGFMDNFGGEGNSNMVDSFEYMYNSIMDLMKEDTVTDYSDMVYYMGEMKLFLGMFLINFERAKEEMDTRWREHRHRVRGRKL